MTVLTIDPGNDHSAFTLTTDDLLPILFAKVPNPELLDDLRNSVYASSADHVAIEMVASYGMPVGREVFETCVWIGRFTEALERRGIRPQLIPRQPVKLHLCHSARAKDSNIVQALLDRFAPGVPNYGKGTKGAPGFFHGFTRDIWQSFALAVYVADTVSGR